jgi:hypothetical protein
MNVINVYLIQCIVFNFGIVKVLRNCICILKLRFFQRIKKSLLAATGANFLYE